VWRHILSIGCLVVAQACGSHADRGANAADDSTEASLDASHNRAISTSLDPDMLASIPDSEIEQAIVDDVFSKLDDDAHPELVIEGLSEGCRALILTWMVEAEVNNGGFNQYYWNTDGIFAEEAVRAFEFFGADQHAALMQEANEVHASEVEAIGKLKDRGTWEAFSESYEVSNLGSLDDRFYRLSEDLSALRTSKIRQSPELFSGE
jgi:hypothetical protein